ncbi:MAG: NAD-dependent epimerase/dehydratase family protein [Deltaproteobacteria bacterium]|nr:NAD-dependent epimerase/dehydratase family protein [Deltaproteobacteria bacterium]
MPGVAWFFLLLIDKKEVKIKALVTGASGHLGYHICKLLSSEDYIVKAFVRSSSYTEHLSHLPVEVCFGDVFDFGTLKNAMEGVDVVFHTAALYKLTEAGKKEKETKDDLIIRTATEGTKNLYHAAFETGVKKIIYTSSVETVGLAYSKNKLLDETHYFHGDFYLYTIAKIESEKIALNLSEKYNLPTVVCNPSTIIGKDDYKLTPSNSMLLNIARFSLFYVDGGQSLVDVEDVARGHLCALSNGKNRERYILSGENTEMKDLSIMIRNIMDTKGPLLKLHKFLLYPAAFVLKVTSGITKKEPFITVSKVSRGVGSYSYYDFSKARRELGYLPKKLSETLPLTLSWLAERYK